jgi:hypothetical protein
MSGDEGLRRVTAETDLKSMFDLHEFEARKSDLVRDAEIAYARSGRDKILEGYSIDWVLEQLMHVVPMYGKDPTFIAEMMNYFLRESGLTITFDKYFNVSDSGVVIKHSGAEEILAAMLEQKDERFDQGMRSLADSYGERFLKMASTQDQSFKLLRQVLIIDVVDWVFDNGTVSQYLNEYFEAHGSLLRLDRYFEVTQDIDGTIIITEGDK